MSIIAVDYGTIQGGGGTPSLELHYSAGLTTSTPYTFSDDYDIVLIQTVKSNSTDWIKTYYSLNGTNLGTLGITTYSDRGDISSNIINTGILENIKSGDVISITSSGTYYTTLFGFKIV